jgi:hypothetical protein
LQAAYATQTYYYQNQTSRPPLLGGSQITANFFSIFDTIPHRASPKLIDDINTQRPVLQVLPSSAFVRSGANIYLAGSINSLMSVTTTNSQNVLRGCVGSGAGVLTNTGTLYTAIFGSISAAAAVTNTPVPASAPGLNLILSMKSNCT